VPPTHDGFTEGEEALIERIVYRIMEKLEPKLMKAVDEKIANHSTACKAPKAMRNLFLIVLGVSIGSALTTGPLAYALGVASKVVQVSQGVP
jgi:hypothetical protein